LSGLGYEELRRDLQGTKVMMQVVTVKDEK
jgi:hypothetical protein